MTAAAAAAANRRPTEVGVGSVTDMTVKRVDMVAIAAVMEVRLDLIRNKACRNRVGG